MHAIGDRANGLVLDAFEVALGSTNENGDPISVKTLRPRLEHAQIMTARDMKRLGELGSAFFFLAFSSCCVVMMRFLCLVISDCEYTAYTRVCFIPLLRLRLAKEFSHFFVGGFV